MNPYITIVNQLFTMIQHLIPKFHPMAQATQPPASDAWDMKRLTLT
jgi:hypothetical protein